MNPRRLQLSDEDHKHLLMLRTKGVLAERIIELTKICDKETEKLNDIRLTLNEYYDALNNRKHGGLAQDKAFMKIEKLLLKSWALYKLECAEAMPP